MATSGTYTYAPSSGGLILQAYRRIGVNRPSVDREKLTDAQQELNLLFSDWSNRGPNLWAVDTLSITLVAAQASYSIDPATVDILDAVLTLANTGQDRIVTSVSRSDYASYPNKTQPGMPSVFWFDRLISPTITVWSVPDATETYTLTLYRSRQTQDVNLASAQQPEIPYRWIDALVWGLAERLAYIWAPDRLNVVGPKAMEVYTAAAAEDTEDAPVRMIPDLSGYMR